MARRFDMERALIAFDLGTTHLKWVVTDLSGQIILAQNQMPSGVRTDGCHSEQNPLWVYDRIVEVLKDARVRWNIQRLSFSCAMHTLLVVDSEGNPLTQSLTWMDSCAFPAAEHLRKQDVAGDLKRQTGVPLHAMSPLVKWIHLRSTLPKSARPVSLKDYLVFRLTNQWQTDYSTAAASGFLGLNGDWCPLALHYADVSARDLPELHPVTFAIPDTTGQFEVVLGGNDAATAHVHLGIAPDGGVGVLAMGTSGALRTTSAYTVDSPELFCYTMGPTRGYLVGSAFSNIGNYLSWVANLFSLSVDEVLHRGIDTVRRGEPLPVAIPYLYGERSPWWREDLQAEWRGLTPLHGRDHMLGSALLSIAAMYLRGLQTLEHQGVPLEDLRIGSGLLDRPFLAQFLSDSLSRPLSLVDAQDASLMGAIDLARSEKSPTTPVIQRYYHPSHSSLYERTLERVSILAAYQKS
ncbi:MAG: hypothetical protein C7B44_13240 [Sulfobacillus thermosulfidooxidans]|nr:MAG: hypothetical protein C7B44_13240 [Sulfobacillus thermosulfidooxidans]